MYGSSMKIQLGTIYLNRTKKYLFPIIKSYGKEFSSSIAKLFKLGVGIGDIITNRCGVHHEKHLFILADATHNITEFAQILDYIREHHAYEDDYPYDVIHNGRLHMIVIRVPDEFITSMEKFKSGEFSKMYTPKQIHDLFEYKGKDKDLQKTYSEVKKVLVKAHNYRIEFAKKIEQEFNVKFPVSEITDEWELEFPALLKEEFFNFKGEE